MMKSTSPTALIAEDEPLLAQALVNELATAWPALQLAGIATHGLEAESMALALQPDVLFFDIRMPGQTGLEAALALLDQWPPEGAAQKPFPALVFVTAFDQYAVEAFDAQALDYLVKPVQPARLAQCVHKVQGHLTRQIGLHGGANHEALMAQLLAQLQATQRQLHPAPAQAKAQPPRLQVVQASHGSSIHLVKVADILYFQALDKYVQVVTASNSYLLRTPIKDLMEQLDPEQFWQIHRGTVVQATAIQRAIRDDSGKLKLEIQGSKEPLTVSRLYSHLFKGM
jgi:DNA-binding LytR/AlgR family response regulator